MQPGLLVDLVTALGAGLIGAAVALRLRQSIILGYLLAGLAIGSFTPGLTRSPEAMLQLAEIGIVLLMFVIGVQLSLRELLRASRVAVLGGLAQVGAMIAVGYAVGRLLGWGSVESYAFGAVISNSSSTVIGKILSDRGELDSRPARIALAWSSVQDISTVALVAVFAVVSPHEGAIGPLLGKAALFFFVLVPLAVWALPRLLRRATLFGSREFFALAVVTMALAMAASASLLGVSLALGAFLAGVVVGESDLSHRILGDAIPVRDVFSGLFFVSIGMLFDPAAAAGAWAAVAIAVALIVLGKGLVTAVIARGLGCSPRIAGVVGVMLAQSAEFSFLMARIGLEQGVLTVRVFQILLSASIVSILLAPAMNELAPRLLRRVRAGPEIEGGMDAPTLEGHAIVCGYGRVGAIVCSLLEAHGKAFVVVEEDLRLVETLRARGVTAVFGDAARRNVLEAAHLRGAHALIVCVPDRMAVRTAVEHAREVGTVVIARTHSREERLDLRRRGVDEAVIGELELAVELGRRTLERLGVDGELIARSLDEVRRGAS